MLRWSPVSRSWTEGPLDETKPGIAAGHVVFESRKEIRNAGYWILNKFTIAPLEPKRHCERETRALSEPQSPRFVLDDGITMSINNPTLYHENFVDFAPLERECLSLGTAMQFSDVDQERERRYRWLRFEWKAPGVRIPAGQQYNFEHLTYLQLTTVIELWGVGGVPEAYRIVGQMDGPAPCTLRDLAQMCLDWELWACTAVPVDRDHA